MCGIAGIFNSLSSAATLEKEIQFMLCTMQHRGYSKFETSNGPGWQLGANRLEIVDRENGHQPKYSSDRSIAVVFNGEIYNFKELKQELIKNGYVFDSDTDTEVIANGYHYWKNHLFDLLDGMFAILIWDDNSDTFVAARDPMGVKPLYYTKDSGKFFFASEVKALLDKSIDIRVFPPGYYVIGNNEPVRYYKNKILTLNSSLKENACVLRGLIRRAVEKRIKTNLPVAVFLSGGVDSSIIAYEAFRQHPDVTAFSIGDFNAEDVLLSKKLCECLRIPFIHIPTSSEELLSLIPEVIWALESFEPNHIRGGTLSYVLSREVAKRGYRIALCGEGADELFGGYREFGIALAQGETEKNISQLFDRFIAELHKTQLQRVDRTSMRFTLEVREPLLDKHILDFAQSLPLNQKISFSNDSTYQNKIVLRESYRGLLPDWIIDREKVVL